LNSFSNLSSNRFGLRVGDDDDDDDIEKYLLLFDTFLNLMTGRFDHVFVTIRRSIAFFFVI
jgi:hypothetical protein